MQTVQDMLEELREALTPDERARIMSQKVEADKKAIERQNMVTVLDTERVNGYRIGDEVVYKSMLGCTKTAYVSHFYRRSNEQPPTFHVALMEYPGFYFPMDQIKKDILSPAPRQD